MSGIRVEGVGMTVLESAQCGQKLWNTFCLLCLVLGFACSLALAQDAEHPLDALTFREYWPLLEVLRDAGHLDEDTVIPMVNLHEPPKEFVWSWTKGQSFPREAIAVVRQGPEAHEAVIDLRKKRLLSWKEVPSTNAPFLIDEMEDIGKEVKEDPRVIEALKRRGIDDLTFIEISGHPPGYFGTDEQRGKRILHLYCNDNRRVHDLWYREIPGITIVFDASEKKVVRVVDEGVTPGSDTLANYPAPSEMPPREVPAPMRVDQPLGHGFNVLGSVVEWQKWRFHFRHDQRAGVIVSTVTYRDGEQARRVLYQGQLAEIFVPYMDPSFMWAYRNYLDEGEFGAEGLAKPLLPGFDCPAHAVYFDGLDAGGNGRPQMRRNITCMFERETGDMSWRHFSEEPESRGKRDLVLRFAAVLDNYDYVFDWIFQQDGSIRIAVGATGIAEVKTVADATADAPASTVDATESPSHEAGDAYGRFVDKNVVAVNHDHYFSYRLDLDVDGPINNFVADRLVTKTLPQDNPRRSIWVRESRIAKTEDEGMMDIDLKKPTLWRVVSTTRKNHVGYPTSYQLMPGVNGITLLAADDYPRRRAGFINHHLWVTPYRPEERYAAGEYPTLSEPDAGLPGWTAANRSIQNTDIVLWHTIGMHHVVRGEDWPVMPVLWHSFELRPFDFFDRNPALDLPAR